MPTHKKAPTSGEHTNLTPRSYIQSDCNRDPRHQWQQSPTRHALSIHSCKLHLPLYGVALIATLVGGGSDPESNGATRIEGGPLLIDSERVGSRPLGLSCVSLTTTQVPTYDCTQVYKTVNTPPATVHNTLHSCRLRPTIMLCYVCAGWERGGNHPPHELKSTEHCFLSYKQHNGCIDDLVLNRHY